MTNQLFVMPLSIQQHNISPKHFRIFLLLAISMCYLIVGAQNKSNFHFRKIQVEDGLSESSAYAILQDSKGFMWVGTKDGLNRYDGHQFRTYRNDINNPKSLGNNFIRSFAEGVNNTLYVGTDDGLYQMNATDESFGLITDSLHKSKIQVTINSLLLIEDRYLWIGTMTGTVFVYDTDTKELKEIEVEGGDLENSAVWTIYRDKSSQIWVGSRKGLLRYDEAKNSLLPIENLFSAYGNYDNEVLTIREDSKGHLWLGTWANGIRRYNKSTNEYRTYFGASDKKQYITHVRSIFEFSDNSLLIGSDDGLYLFNTETFENHRVDIPQLSSSLSDQSIYSIERDREGAIWIGTYFGGVNYLNTSLLSIETYYPDAIAKALTGKAISQFCEDEKGNFWIATEDGGVNYFDAKSKLFSQPIKTSYHNTHALLLDGTKLWIGTFSRGLDIYDTQTKQIVNYKSETKNINTLNDDCIFSLSKTKSGDIYIGTPVGLNKYNKQTNSFVRIPEVTGFVYDIKEDDAGDIWVAMYGTGVIRWDKGQERWINYEDVLDKNDPILRSKLTSIFIDSQKRIFFTSENRGIFIYDSTKDSFRNISEAEGLPNNVIYGILDDQFGNIWASCNKGIINFHLSNPSDYKLYTKVDGLQSNQFNYKSSYKANDGKLYFGGVNGFSCFYPQELRSNKNMVVPPVEITDFKLLANTDIERERMLLQNLNKNQKLEVPYTNSSFSISYVSLSYKSQDQNQYAYKMSGVDEDWNYVGNNRSVTYVNLSPGKYTFHVKASNNDGLWNDVGDTIEIEILPPFWRSLPAKVFYLLLIASIAFSLFYFSVRRNKEKQVRFLESFKAEQESLAFKSKIDFFTTIAHEIRTPLSLISAPLEEIIESEDGNENTKQNLSIIDKNCDRLSVLITQLLDFRKMDSVTYILKPEEINLNEYIQELFLRFKKTAQQRKIDITLSLNTDASIYIISDGDALIKIVGNLLTNALKYTKDKIELSVVASKNKQITISVTDNGKGISDEHKELIFDPFYQIQRQDNNIGTGIGLSLVKHLTDLLGGQINVKDNPEGGSIFSFIFSDLKVEDTQNIISDIDGKEQKRKTAELSVSHSLIIEHSLENNILVVEDNEELGLFIKGLLQENYAIDIALSAAEAYDLLETTNYNLIISDIMMPGEDGLSFTKSVKSNVNFSHIPLILLSATTENSIKIEGLDVGADVFIEKPFSPLFLKAQIASLLENRRILIEAFNHSPLASYSMLATNKRDEEFLEKLNKEIEINLADVNFSVESISEALGVSRSNLQRKLKSICAVTPGEYLRNYRLKRACILLLEADKRVNEVAFEVGFNSASYFSKAFTKHYNISPKEFIEKHINQIKG